VVREGDEVRRQRLLVVDDEVHIAEALTASLRHAGFDVRPVFDGSSAVSAAQEWSPDLLLLDVMLPDMTGYDVCRELIMAGSDAAVIFLSARDQVSDRIRGFGVGADDYVTKPFSLEEVIARVRAVLLRRSRGRAVEPDGSVFVFEDLRLDDDRHLVSRGGSVIDRVLSKAQIVDHVWRYDFQGDGNIVESFVSLLRKKLNATGPPLIQTVRGFGYVLRSSP